MSTPDSVLSQLQSDMQRANNITGKSDVTIHDAISSLILGYGNGSANTAGKKFQGEVTFTSNKSAIEHNCNKTKYLFIIKAESVPEVTNGVWFAKTIIGIYDEAGIDFNNSTYNTVSAGNRFKDGTSGTTVWCSDKSTSNSFAYSGNSLPSDVKCIWELYDLSDTR
jgi:hypothetical protein